ncbi:MAG: NAD-dependent deacylase [Desulfobacteraceae bacterium]|jgi:NAD-dependent deacetylase
MDSQYKEAAKEIAASKKCITLTGAGISAESGIPTFRSKGGMWNDYDPTVYASLETFIKDPSKYWSIRGEFIRNYNNYIPNEGHSALSRLEKSGLLKCIITQNIDGLHKKAGSEYILEIHGSLRESYCMSCSREYIAPDIPAGEVPLCACGGVLKPNTVLFGEQLPAGVLEEAQLQAESCDVMLLIGTSAVVYPAAALPVISKRNGAKIIEINIESSFNDSDIVIEEKAGTALPEIEEAVNKLINQEYEHDFKIQV